MLYLTIIGIYVMLYNISNEINSVGEIITRINLIRIHANLNQQQLAQKLDISQPAVSKYLKDRIPPAAILLKLAQLGATSIEWLLTGKKEHFFVEDSVRETTAGYLIDVDIKLAKKISGLNAESKNVLIKLITLLSNK